MNFRTMADSEAFSFFAIFAAKLTAGPRLAPSCSRLTDTECGVLDLKKVAQFFFSCLVAAAMPAAPVATGPRGGRGGARGRLVVGAAAAAAARAAPGEHEEHGQDERNRKLPHDPTVPYLTGRHIMVRPWSHHVSRRSAKGSQ